ncbi:MAG: glycosyl transferase family 4 [Betaproteobacteria bacterium]|nr:glycosyl transferase family 4 [Betaproteobacteria bacterium]MDE2622506.1 glycosyl transferase family 4 [Betaproteobacteria bacterium]
MNAADALTAALGWALLAALLSWLGALFVCRAASHLGLVALPNARSSHTRPTPHGGGLGMVLAGSAIGGWLAWTRAMPLLGGVLILAGLLALLGLRDDVRPLPAGLRLAVQALLCAALLALMGVLPAPGGGLPLMLGGGLFVFWFLSGLWWVNLFNFMDGIDGFAGTEALFMLSMAALLAAWGHPERFVHPVWILMPCLAAAAAGFLRTNWPPARVFMGDVGSTWMAFMIFAFALMTIQAGWIEPPVWLILGAGFMSDASVTLVVRMLTGQRVTQAHRSHAYQRLARRWGSHRHVTLLLLAFNGFWLAPLAVADQVSPQWSGLWLGLAFTPALLGVWHAGAGRADER